jgi:hypothetical protein
LVSKPDPIALGLADKLDSTTFGIEQKWQRPWQSDPVAFGIENRKDNAPQVLQCRPQCKHSYVYIVVHNAMSLCPQYMHNVFPMPFKV